MSDVVATIEPPFDVVVERDVMVEMRDGVRLATDIHRPARDGRPAPGRFPVLLERTPYDKTGVRVSDRTAADPEPKDRTRVAAEFVRHGYVVVIQDCRGRHRSEGRFTKYLGEGQDGFDTVAWIRAQPWSDGRLGTWGLSYSAHTQTSLAALRPPGLKAMVLDCGGFANAYRGGIRHGGAFELKQATWAHKHARQGKRAQSDPLVAAALEAENLEDWFRAMPWKRGHSPLRWVSDYEDYFFDQWEHGRFDEFWRQPDLYAAGHYDAFEGIDVLLMCGWYDPYSQTTTDNFTGLSARASGRTEMILGPWTHGQRSITFAGDADFGPEATLDGSIARDYYALRVGWFDRWLKGEGGDSPPRVRYFRMGGGTGRRLASGRIDQGGRWRACETWPPPGTVLTPYYLHADGGLSPDVPAADVSPASFVHDPADPVPTIGGPITSGEPVMRGGAFDQRTHPRLFGARPPYLPLAARSDVLVFQTAPLAEDVEITGSILVRLWISADAPDVDFVVKLIDVHPPNADYVHGYAMNVTDGILRCRYRSSWERPELLTPGEVAEITVEPPPSSNLFKAGHRIRIDIQGSSFPRFDVNPATGAPEGKGQVSRRAVQTVFLDRDRPSHVVLPVVPA